ncbi:hypothetical protein CG747_03940 [Streptomyces sp. CB02959]|nr:hypothetical protein CG747_03940 [Streptomyces sp. CB02959]
MAALSLCRTGVRQLRGPLSVVAVSVEVDGLRGRTRGSPEAPRAVPDGGADVEDDMVKAARPRTAPARAGALRLRIAPELLIDRLGGG